MLEENKVITTQLPLSLSVIKDYFADKKSSFLINYEEGVFKGDKLIHYISNINIPIDVEFDIDTAEGQELVKAYMESASFVTCCPNIDLVVIDLLLNYRFSEEKHPFVMANQNLFDEWMSILYSLQLYNFHIVSNDIFKDYVGSFPKREITPLAYLNFVNLLKYEHFFAFYKEVDEKEMSYYTTLFDFTNDAYIFRGKNLFSFWANENNPLFMLMFSVASGHRQQYREEFNKQESHTSLKE